MKLKKVILKISLLTIGLVGLYSYNTKNDIEPIIKSHQIGDFYGGGIVFFVDSTQKHGLIASLHDLDEGKGVAWHGNTKLLIGDACQSWTDGVTNTEEMVRLDTALNTAAVLCNKFESGGFKDWYLPAINELELLAKQDTLLNRILENDKDSLSKPLVDEFNTPTHGRYWSSTESGLINARYCKFVDGYHSANVFKSSLYGVRAIRKF